MSDLHLIERHCSTCKWYYCYNASMYCSHPKRCHKITAARKHGCEYWIYYDDQN